MPTDSIESMSIITSYYDYDIWFAQYTLENFVTAPRYWLNAIGYRYFIDSLLFLGVVSDVAYGQRHGRRVYRN
jgi:hypothetical protein